MWRPLVVVTPQLRKPAAFLGERAEGLVIEELVPDATSLAFQQEIQCNYGIYRGATSGLSREIFRHRDVHRRVGEKWLQLCVCAFKCLEFAGVPDVPGVNCTRTAVVKPALKAI